MKLCSFGKKAIPEAGAQAANLIFQLNQAIR
jgi:hypothetical protein